MSLRVVISVTHLLGVGHLTRAAAVARAFARAGHATTLFSGGMPAPLVNVDGVKFEQLPPVRTTGTDFRTLLDESGQPVTPARLEARRDMLVELVEEIRPDIILTELYPFGRRALAGEFATLIDHAKATRPDALIIASIRDILVAPARPERIAHTHEILREFYDAVLVHGDPDLVPIEASWPLDEGARTLIRYTGYVDDGASAAAGPDDKGSIVVSGGGSAASLPLYRAAIAAAKLVTERPWRILVGNGVAEADFAELRQAAPSHVTLERARPDFRALLSGAAVSVSQAGYNTVIDVLRSRARAVFVPFEQGHESEQRLRAERLADLGMAEVITEADLSPRMVAGRVRRTLQKPRPSAPPIRLDGAERSVTIIEELATRRLGPGKRSSKWSILDEVFERAAEKDAVIPFWWRDDDAVAHTPQLDRLLALAQRLHVPIAIAAIPAYVETSLVSRLAREPLVRMLVHGLAHTNHARADKKSEFGLHRPITRLRADAAEALRIAQSRFGEQLLPVLVPPWNRIAPELAKCLPDLGYRGLSAFGERKGESMPDFVQINTHIDPIAWHEGRGLMDSDALLRRLAETISARILSSDDPEPVGLLTHHLIQDEAVWEFCEELLTHLAGQPMVRFPDLDAMFVGAQTFAT